MNKINISILFLILVFACKDGQTPAEAVKQTTLEVSERPKTGVDYLAFGEPFDDEAVISHTALSEKYAGMAVADTVRTKFRATVTDVCKAKGCWMRLQLGEGREAMVRFKDYGFFVPKDIEGREVVVNGQAFVTQMSVEDQKHYARDGGLSEAEIAKITGPKKTFGFEADGVLLAKE
ncbi:DUF4920 domain-containing protein [Pricia sp. S334]|uniref:DUF4920 domain-containing protein n=1 Tax=Pricia mediterranea TaxID=3076079 RepID=A0ABU3L8U2_9FLAO|nr:DUF4920 domain-containing protein [Pricia sp. S334]MDT7829726.1 DUF4920 domain-containing protein [Pricia sp. S334]